MSRLGRNSQVLATDYSHHRQQQQQSSCVTIAKRPRFHNSGEPEALDNTMAEAAAATSPANAQNKRPNFSLAVANPNGVNKITQSLATGKPGTARKLIIKNFKGTCFISVFGML